MRNPTLFNMQTDNREPDWSLFDGFEVSPCYVDPDGTSEPVDDDDWHLADVWTVYGHLKTGGVDALTDVSTERLAYLCIDRMILIAASRGVTLEY